MPPARPAALTAPPAPSAMSQGAPEDLTPGGARQHRANRAFYTGLASRSASIAAGLATVPLALSALGSEGFGVWSVITSTLALMAFLDFGIGNGAMGRITEALAGGDDSRVAALIRNAYVMLLSIALLVAGTAMALYASGALAWLADASGSFLGEHLGLTLAFVIGYALVIPATFVQRLAFAYQRAGQATVMQLAFSLTYLVVALAGWFWDLGLAAFVLGYVGSMALVYGAYTAAFLHKFAPVGLWSTNLDLPLMRSLSRDAGLFFLLQATVALVYNSDPLILSSFVDGADVAVYATVLKIFSIVILVNGLLLGPMWPAFSDARARNDWAWIRSAYYRSRRRSLFLGLGLAGTLVLIGNPAISLWTGGRIDAPILLLLTMAVWVVLEGYGQCMAMLLNAARVIRMQVVVAGLLLLCGTALKVSLAPSLGIYGPLLGTIVSFTLIVALYETYYVKTLLDAHA